MRTRISICRRKRRFPDAATAAGHAASCGLPLLAYRCDRCGRFHLTSRRKGRRPPAPAPDAPG